MAKKAVATPPVNRRYRQAVDLFERAVKALGRKDIGRARDLLDELLDEHADERDLVERARTYRAMCDRARERRPPRPKTFEELLNYGVVLHNRGDFARAVKYLQQALEIHPRNEGALYCLAAAQARAGDATAALKALKSAIHANPAARAQARRDDDFEPLHGAVEFHSLVAPTVS
jgi:tetratricopeptide (TPR) repeat protein